MTCVVCFNKGGSWLTNGVCERCGRVAPNSGRPRKKTQKSRHKSQSGKQGGGLFGLIIIGIIIYLLFFSTPS